MKRDLWQRPIPMSIDPRQRPRRHEYVMSLKFRGHVTLVKRDPRKRRASMKRDREKRRTSMNRRTSMKRSTSMKRRASMKRSTSMKRDLRKRPVSMKIDARKTPRRCVRWPEEFLFFRISHFTRFLISHVTDVTRWKEPDERDLYLWKETHKRDLYLWRGDEIYKSTIVIDISLFCGSLFIDIGLLCGSLFIHIYVYLISSSLHMKRRWDIYIFVWKETHKRDLYLQKWPTKETDIQENGLLYIPSPLYMSCVYLISTSHMKRRWDKYTDRALILESCYGFFCILIGLFCIVIGLFCGFHRK